MNVSNILFVFHIKLSRNLHNPGPASVAVAKALADHCPPEENILQRSALLQVRNTGSKSPHLTFILSSDEYFHPLFQQEELNSSDCGWALLLTESDPQVLSCLLWTWLERLKVSGSKQEVMITVFKGFIVICT